MNNPAVDIDAGGTKFRVGLVSFDANMKASVSDFSQAEIYKSCEILGIEENKIPEYFFTLKVQKTKQN